MNKINLARLPSISPRTQGGAALAVVLILLLVMTLLGIFVLRGTLMEERMSASALDRSLGFQSAESALREAEEAIRVARVTNASIGFDCSATTDCPAIPPNAYTGNCTSGTQNCWINASSEAVSNASLSAGVPQYYIEYMGQRTSDDEFGLGGSANQNQYGGGGGVPTASFYRVTARSNSPSADRSVVVLQTTVVAK